MHAPASYGAAHPRSRGENKMQARDLPFDAGSSPLTRGKLGAALPVPFSHRLIPAHAGKTYPGSGTQASAPAHPRSRGENRAACNDRADRRGSSPLTRGKPVTYADLIGMLRLIPAHAGKTINLSKQFSVYRAHPRSRGENLHLVGTRLEDSGSSPLTQGKRRHVYGRDGVHRLIPAHAGKTR